MEDDEPSAEEVLELHLQETLRELLQVTKLQVNLNYFERIGNFHQDYVETKMFSVGQMNWGLKINDCTQSYVKLASVS